MFAPCVNRIKMLFIVPTDAHYYKIVEKLRTLKTVTFAPTCCGSHRNHHQGAVLCLAKTTSVVSVVLVGIDVANVMAAYQPVVRVCSSR
jgi:hypothetical protein